MTDIQTISLVALAVAFFVFIWSMRYLDYLEEKLDNDRRKK